jgi:hypothetical protein
MMADPIGKQALKDHELLDDVILHSELAFPSGWMRFDEAKAGKLLILPPEGMIKDLGRDYDAMKGMVLGDAPEFGWVLDKLRAVNKLFCESQ